MNIRDVFYEDNGGPELTLLSPDKMEKSLAFYGLTLDSQIVPPVVNTINYVCSECGSGDIEVQMWVNMNTMEVNGDVYSGKAECFCNNCEEHTYYEEVSDDPLPASVDGTLVEQ